MITNPLRRLIDKVREVGPVFALRLVILRLVPSFVYDGAVLIVTDCDIAALAAADDPTAPIRYATPDEIDKLSDLGLPSDQANTLFANNHRVKVVELGGEFVSCEWFATDQYRMLNWFEYHLPPKTIFGFGAYTRPDHRGKRLISSMWKRVAAEIQEEGFVHYLATVNVLNRNSLRAAEGIPGITIIGRIWYVRLLGFTVVRVNEKTYFGWWTSRRPFVLNTETLYPET